MRAWSTIVASGPCLIVNLSADVANRSCPIAKRHEAPKLSSSYS
jgi:hypothetical protein